MKNRKKFTEMAKQLLHKRAGLRNPQIIHPVRDWSIGLVVSLCVFSASAFWSAETYIKYRSMAVSDSVTLEESPAVYKATLVAAALAEFDRRESVYGQLIAGDGVEEVIVTSSTIDIIIGNLNEATSTVENIEVSDVVIATTTVSGNENIEDNTTSSVENSATEDDDVLSEIDGSDPQDLFLPGE